MKFESYLRDVDHVINREKGEFRGVHCDFNSYNRIVEISITTNPSRIAIAIVDYKGDCLWYDKSFEPLLKHIDEKATEMRHKSKGYKSALEKLVKPLLVNKAIKEIIDEGE